MAVERLADAERPGHRAVRAAEIRQRNPVADPARHRRHGARRETAALRVP